MLLLYSSGVTLDGLCTVYMDTDDLTYPSSRYDIKIIIVEGVDLDKH